VNVVLMPWISITEVAMSHLKQLRQPEFRQKALNSLHSWWRDRGQTSTLLMSDSSMPFIIYVDNPEYQLKHLNLMSNIRWW